MRGYANWNYDPYLPYDREFSGIYIVRISPNKEVIEFEWYSKLEELAYYCVYRERNGEDIRIRVTDNVVILRGLKDKAEYEFCIESESGVRSQVRLAKTGYVPGKVVNYIHPEDKAYDFSGYFPASPSLVRLKSGALLASHDVFGHGTPQNLSMIFRSDDDGETWRYVTQLFPCFWGKLFTYKDKLYMLGVSREYGDLLIGCSEDEGKTWSLPTVILRGSAENFEGGVHKASGVITEAYGRLWTAIEYGTWKKHFSAIMLSIDVNDDLMAGGNWALTEPLMYDDSWENAWKFAGAIEGNAVVGPDGEIYNCMRAEERLLILKADKNIPEKKLEFVEIVGFPPGKSKFEIHRYNGKYISVGNVAPHRNRLTVMESENLRSWKVYMDIFNYGEDYSVAFQYPSCLCENDRLTVLSRTAFNDANTFHDNNYITIHKIDLKQGAGS